MRKTIIILQLLVFVLFTANHSLLAQVSDDFSDGDFTNNPVWSGDDTVFTVFGNQLQSNKQITNSTFYLSTSNNLVTDCQWEFYVNLTFNTSGANYVDIYLVSDAENPSIGTNNGYFIRIGGTPDEISLYKKSSGTSTKIIDGTDGTTNSSNNSLKVKVIRDSNNDWFLYYDNTGTGSSYLADGTINDATHLTSAYFCIEITQSTASFFNKHFFDDFYIGPIILDTDPPLIISVTPINSTQVEVLYNEDVETTSAETITNYNINSGVGNPTTATRDFANNNLVLLTFPNPFVNGQTYTLTTINVEDLALNAITSATNDFFYFVPQPATYRDVVFNEIFADPTPVIGLPAVEYFELYNASNNIYDLSNWQYINTSTAKTLPSFYLYPNSYVILCAITDTALFSPFGDVIGISGSWTALSNSSDSLTIIDNFGTIMDIVNYDVSWYNNTTKADGGYSLELINPVSPCTTEITNWTASNDVSGGTPGTQNSVYSIAPDVTAPILQSISIVNNSTLLLSFNEKMDSASVVAGSYAFDNSLTFQAITVTEGNTTALIELTSSITEGIIYNVTVSNVNDCSGNLISSTSKNFFISFEPQVEEVIINEIFCDPSPVIGLPNAEYVELLNLSNKIINLSGCSFDGLTISTGFMLPGEYVILCAKADTALFSPFGHVIALSSAPELTNSGELLTLENASSTLIDEVTYDISWYNDENKNDGGYSLELINPEAICAGGSNNWTGSNSVTGGTPGQVNSVYDNSPDVTSPDLVSVEVLSSTSIILKFSEPMDVASLASGAYSIDKDLSIIGDSVFPSDISSVILFLSADLDTSTTYTVTASNVIDCPGNPISVKNSISFVIGYAPKPGEIIINEIFADPTPAIVFPDAEFVELYNKTDKLFNLKGYTIKGKTISAGFILPNGFVTICYVGDTSIYNDYGKTIGLTSKLTLTNSGEELNLESADGVIINAVDYSIDWHTSTTKKDGGWSLELINPNNPCSGSNNWTSSIGIDGSTPGYQNSVFDISPDITAPIFTKVEIIDSNTVKLTFNEPVDTSNIGNIIISVAPLLNVNSVNVANSTGDEVFVMFSTNIDTAVSYTINVSNIEDCMGNINTIAASLNFELGYAPSFGDLIINEIFIDPSPIVGLPEAEFIEIYNRSNKKIDLSFANINGKSINNFLLSPNEYAIITADEDTGSFTGYQNVIAVNSWITLNNTSMELEITNLNGESIDKIHYFSSWYHDANKDGGGWTIERKNPDSECNFANNWAASINPKGGTPGAQNSVYSIEADVIAPTVIKIQVVDSLTLIVDFSESMNASSIHTALYTFDNNTVKSIDIDSSDFSSITIQLSTYLIESDLHNLIISEATDCPGNKIIDSKREFVLPEQGSTGDLIINEVLFNPPTGGQDFVEIYNNSNKYIDLGTWYLANFDNDSISNIKPISSEQEVIAPGQFYAITKDSSAVKKSYPLSFEGNYIQAATLPTYSNASGVVILLNNNFEQVDRFDYDESMHFAILNAVKGVSLERLDYNRETNDATNWNSAAQSVGFATPGLQNSQFQPANPGDDAITVEPEIFSPDGDRYNDNLNISYQLDEPGYVGNISIFDTQGRLTRKLMVNEYLSPSGTISWNGITDTGEKAGIGIYIIFAEFYNEAGNIIKAKKPCVVGGKL